MAGFAARSPEKNATPKTTIRVIDRNLLKFSFIPAENLFSFLLSFNVYLSLSNIIFGILPLDILDGSRVLVEKKLVNSAVFDLNYLVCHGSKCGVVGDYNNCNSFFTASVLQELQY